MSALVRVYLSELTASPASQAVKGPSVLTYGSPACWPAGLAQLPGVWHGASRWCSLLIFGPQHAVHFDTLNREESPGDEMSRGKGDMKMDLRRRKNTKLENKEFNNSFKVLPLR